MWSTSCRKGEWRAFYAKYRADGWGRAAYPPRMMVKVILYGYSVGVRSARKLEQALELDMAFRYLAANLRPDFRTVSDFRKDHLERGLNRILVRGFSKGHGELVTLVHQPQPPEAVAPPATL